MSNQKNIVFVYSSDYRKLYKKDIYNVLSFPAGFVMHFRYRLKWVSDELKNNLPLEGNQVIMIAAIINNDDQTNPEYVLMPFRKGRIISTITDGDKLSCLLTDILIPYFILFFISAASGFLIGRNK